MGEIRIGLVGAGRMGSFHGKSIAHKIHGAKLTAITAPRTGPAERLASELGASKTYTDPREMFQDPSVDAVIIATPPVHMQNLLLLQRMKEKPFFVKSQWQ